MCDAGCLQKEFARFVSFISNANGRDKFSKSIQYSSKLFFYILATQGDIEAQKDLSGRLKKLSGGVSTSRKCNRLFKSLAEYNKIVTLLTKPNDDPTLVGLKIAFAFAYSLYWYYDNKVFLGKVGYLKDLNVKEAAVKGSRWWVLGLIFSFVIMVKELKKLQDKKNKEVALNGNESDKVSKELFLKQLSLVSWCGDIVCASNAAGYVNMALGHDFNDGILGAAGFISALLTIYRIYPASK